MTIGAVSAASAANTLLAGWRSLRPGFSLWETPASASLPPIEPAAPAGAPGTETHPSTVDGQQPVRRPGVSPVKTTAYQRNADGDDVALSSRQSELTPEEQAQVAELKARDAEVRAHEQAHLAAAGGLARGGPRYTYQTGPDGRRYAVGGSVSIDTSPGRTPEETLAKARKIRAAALAPAEPSSTDRSVAAKAAQMEAQARREIAEARAADREQAPTSSRAAASGSSVRSTPVSALKLDVYG